MFNAHSINAPKALLHALIALSINVPFSAVVAQTPLTINYSGCLQVDLFGPVHEIDIPNFIDTSYGCYELRLDGNPVKLEKGWSLEQAIADLESNKSAYPNANVEGYFSGLKIGYELYWDGVRVGYEPGWTLEEAIANLEWNKATYSDKQVEGRFYGITVGYELYWDGVRVGYEPGWTYEQAIANLQWNQQTYPNKQIEGKYNGSSLSE